MGWGGHELGSSQGLGVGLQALRAKAEQKMARGAQRAREARGEPCLEPHPCGRNGLAGKGKAGREERGDTSRVG